MAGMKTPRSNICAVGASTVGDSDVSRATPAIAGEKLESPPFKSGEYVKTINLLRYRAVPQQRRDISASSVRVRGWAPQLGQTRGMTEKLFYHLHLSHNPALD
jgi:hypothetical protein